MIRLHVNAPAIQEAYSGSWESPVPHEPENLWEMRLPLLVAGHAVGFLEIAGENDGHSNTVTIDLVQDILEPFELRLNAFAEKAIVSTVGERRRTKKLESHRRSRLRTSCRRLGAGD